MFNTIIGNKETSQKLLGDPIELKKKQLNTSKKIIELLKKPRKLISKDEQYRQPFESEYRWNKVFYFRTISIKSLDN